MSRRVAALVTAALALLGGLALFTAPAQARSTAVVEMVASPLSLGDYCAAKVEITSMIGFYNGSLSCYRRSGSGLAYVGSGSPAAACAYFAPTYTYIGHAQGVSQALVCRYSV
ncbi:hypothetical protein DQ384_36825 [Sphaerisporangium album]|uniref:Uncharacterized protein n=1 Tax=Sphaerisporangium album TaxID=509200 RepID=A0A367ES65_9ACTN|nr:hypothetical protein [Sphaerisporangium album]RCG20966.1 hypothetical protein DQ384_36825 [Sphaerisporangium album]